MTHPVVEATGTLTGLYNLATDQGVEKTINHVKNNEYGKATLSALGDIMDISPITGAVKGTVLGANALRQGANLTNAVKTIKDNFPILKFQRIFSRPNRAKHAYATINPFGYDNPIKRGIK